MSTLASQNILNIDNIVTSTADQAENYERNSRALLHIEWITWLIFSITGVVISALELIGHYEIPVIVLSSLISLISVLRMKFKPSKNGHRYKDSASKLRKLGREAGNLKFSKLTPEEVEAKLEIIFSQIDSITLEVYAINGSDQGMIRADNPRIDIDRSRNRRRNTENAEMEISLDD